MAKTEDAPKPEQAPRKKVRISILDKDGNTAKRSLLELNKKANAAMYGRQKRHSQIVKTVAETMKQQLRRA